MGSEQFQLTGIPTHVVGVDFLVIEKRAARNRDRDLEARSGVGRTGRPPRRESIHPSGRVEPPPVSLRQT
jgi:hypothetical protein